ncbi:uncharacterized protein LOC130715565 [Lotus japonicus]|uniref:uncharacterized protein LOC130715565 n=1 Tax=Lotus japonicus TaxID=34305 RepID=UPI0025834763|nr:uncharacterized protein LOC130715565 [Lotus japonicus]
MSAIIVCGKRSALFQPSSPPISTKRIRCSSSSSSSSSPPSFPSLLHHLTTLFPFMDPQLLEKALEECGNDLDSAIRSLNELRLGGSVHQSIDSAATGSDHVAVDLNDQPQSQGETKCDTEDAASEDQVAGQSYPLNGAEWVDHFVREMMSASNMDDAKARASRVLEALEKSICERSRSETERENMMLKEQVEALIQENIILKRALCIQHERQKEYENKNQELKDLKQLVSQYQEQLRTLEVNNYALTMHLKQAEQSSSIPGHFHPDVF